MTKKILNSGTVLECSNYYLCNQKQTLHAIHPNGLSISGGKENERSIFGGARSEKDARGSAKSQVPPIGHR